MTNTDTSRQASSGYQPLISIIIPALNAEKTLDSCLSAILSLDYPKDKFEVILVDNGSTDSTLRIAKKYNTRIFVKPEISISALRNFGVRMAQGDIYAFSDSDCLPSKNWLNSALIHLRKHEVAVAGCGYDIPHNACWIEKAWFFFRNMGAHSVNHVPGGNFIVKKQPFTEVGGFNENLITGEDSEFCTRLREIGYVIISDNKIQSIHLGNPKSLYAFFKKEIWYGKGMLGTKRIDKWNRPFIVSIIYLLSYLGLILGLPIAFYLNTSLPVFIPISVIILIPLIASFRHGIQSMNLKNFPFLVPIYFAYCMGRMISLFYLLNSYKPQKVMNHYKNVRSHWNRRARIHSNDTIIARGISGNNVAAHVLTQVKLQEIEEADFIGEHVERGRLLDAGSGNGNMLFHILSSRKHIIPFAMDISEELLFRLKQRDGAYKKIYIVQGNVLDLPFRTNFDSIICLGVVQYLCSLSDVNACIQSFNRILKCGQILAVDIFFHPFCLRHLVHVISSFFVSFLKIVSPRRHDYNESAEGFHEQQCLPISPFWLLRKLSESGFKVKAYRGFRREFSSDFFGRDVLNKISNLFYSFNNKVTCKFFPVLNLFRTRVCFVCIKTHNDNKNR